MRVAMVLAARRVSRLVCCFFFKRQYLLTIFSVPQVLKTTMSRGKNVEKASLLENAFLFFP